MGVGESFRKNPILSWKGGDNGDELDTLISKVFKVHRKIGIKVCYGKVNMGSMRENNIELDTLIRILKFPIVI